MNPSVVMTSAKRLLLAGVLSSGIWVWSGWAQTQPSAPPAATQSPVGNPYRFPPNRFATRALLYYPMVWGVDSLNVKMVESGEILRFAYRVVDADKAKPLHDKKVEPILIDPQAGVSLSIPALENIGQLRQTSTPEAGKSYWMAFSNSGRPVKRGDRVTVQIGQFHADGLQVD